MKNTICWYDEEVKVYVKFWENEWPSRLPRDVFLQVLERRINPQLKKCLTAEDEEQLAQEWLMDSVIILQ